MADKNENNKLLSSDEALYTCPLCSGTGRIRRKCDETDICEASDVKEELTCLLCRGRGKVKRYLRSLRIRPRHRLSSLLSRKRRFGAGLSRSGRLSRSPIILLPPGTPLSGWPDGDMVPQFSPESAYPQGDINYTIVTDDNYPEEEYPRETTLTIADAITITIGKEFAANNFIVDSGLVDINFLEALEAASDPATAHISYGVGSTEYLETLLQEVLPTIQSSIMQTDEDFCLGEVNSQLAEPPDVDISQYDPGLCVDIEDRPAFDLTLQLNAQSTSASFTELLPPDVLGQVNPPDITGVEGPVGFDFNTDIIGNTW